MNKPECPQPEPGSSTFADILEDGPCGFLVTATDGSIIRANTTLCRWLGYEASDLVGKRRLKDLLTVGGRVFLQTHWAPLLQVQRSVAEVKLDIQHKNGHTVPTLVNAVRRRHDDIEYDQLAIMVVAERNKYERELLRARHNAELALDARREAERALQQAGRRKDEFLATLAHELRNPLAPMRNVLELLRSIEFSDAQVTWSREVLERQVRHMTHLVDDLLEVSRITQGKLALRKQTIELTTVMQGAVEASRPLVLASLHELSVTYPAEPLWLDADPTRLSQMIQNLLNNAAKYTPEGGKISLAAERDGAWAVISVRDSGIGIARANLDGVFEMFSQLAPALERSQGGLGIGLSLVKALAHLHGGTVQACSEGANQGSEFIIRVPLTQSEAAQQDINLRSSAVNGDRRRVVIIDDNEDAALSLAMVLEVAGYDARTAFRGLAGLELAREFDADSLVVDIGLPDINGYEIARRVSSEAWGQGKRLIALTGWGQEQDKRDAAAAGFRHHFTKPADIDSLLDALAGLRDDSDALIEKRRSTNLPDTA